MWDLFSYIVLSQSLLRFKPRRQVPFQHLLKIQNVGSINLGKVVAKLWRKLYGLLFKPGKDVADRLSDPFWKEKPYQSLC